MIAHDLISEYLCYDILNSKKTLSKIDKVNYRMIEKMIPNFYLTLKTHIKSQQNNCQRDILNKLAYNKCISNNWNRFFEDSFSTWSNQNPSFEKYKSLFKHRSLNKQDKLKRSIATEIKQ